MERLGEIFVQLKLDYSQYATELKKQEQEALASAKKIEKIYNDITVKAPVVPASTSSSNPNMSGGSNSYNKQLEEYNKFISAKDKLTQQSVADMIKTQDKGAAAIMRNNQDQVNYANKAANDQLKAWQNTYAGQIKAEEKSNAATLAFKKAMNQQRLKEDSAAAKSTTFFGHNIEALTKRILITSAALTLFYGSMRLISAEFIAGLSAVEDYRLKVASMGAFLTTFSNSLTKTNASEIYRASNEEAKNLVLTMEKLDARTIASGKDLTTMAEQFIKGGVKIDTTNQGTLDGFVNIANALKLMTQGQNQEIQMRQEIRALVQGQMKDTNLLAKTLQSIDPNIKEHIKLWRQQGTLIENVGSLLAGFGPAAKDLENTWAVVGSTMETVHNKVLRGMFQPAFDSLIKMAQEWNRSLMDADGNLTPLAYKFIDIGKTTLDVLGILASWIATIAKIALIAAPLALIFSKWSLIATAVEAGFIASSVAMGTLTASTAVFNTVVLANPLFRAAAIAIAVLGIMKIKDAIAETNKEAAVAVQKSEEWNNKIHELDMASSSIEELQAKMYKLNQELAKKVEQDSWFNLISKYTGLNFKTEGIEKLREIFNLKLDEDSWLSKLDRFLIAIGNISKPIGAAKAIASAFTNRGEEEKKPNNFSLLDNNKNVMGLKKNYYSTPQMSYQADIDFGQPRNIAEISAAEFGEARNLLLSPADEMKRANLLHGLNEEKKVIFELTNSLGKYKEAYDRLIASGNVREAGERKNYLLAQARVADSIKNTEKAEKDQEKYDSERAKKIEEYFNLKNKLNEDYNKEVESANNKQVQLQKDLEAELEAIRGGTGETTKRNKKLNEFIDAIEKQGNAALTTAADFYKLIDALALYEDTLDKIKGVELAKEMEEMEKTYLSLNSKFLTGEQKIEAQHRKNIRAIDDEIKKYHENIAAGGKANEDLLRDLQDLTRKEEEEYKKDQGNYELANTLKGKSFKELSDGIQKSFIESFEKIFDKGENLFKNLKDSILNLFKSMLARMAAMAIAKPIMVPIVSTIGGALGMSGNAIGSQLNSMGIGDGTASGGSGLNTASTGFSLASGWNSLSGGAGAALTGLQIGAQDLAISAGMDGLAEGIMGMSTSAFGVATMGIGTALLGILQGQDFQTIAKNTAFTAGGAALGSFFGPAGTIIGGILGGVVGSLFGGSGGGPSVGGSAWSTGETVLGAGHTATQDYTRMLELSKATQSTIELLATSLGGSAAGLVIGSGYSTDPEGDSPSYLHGGVKDTNNNLIYSTYRAVGRSQEELTAALELSTKQSILAALQSLPLNDFVDKVLDKLDIQKLTATTADQALSFVEAASQIVAGLKTIGISAAELASGVFDSAKAGQLLSGDVWDVLSQTSRTLIQDALVQAAKSFNGGDLAAGQQQIARITSAVSSISAAFAPIQEIIDTNGLSEYSNQLRNINKQFDSYGAQLEAAGVDLAKYTDLEKARGIAIKDVLKNLDMSGFADVFKDIGELFNEYRAIYVSLGAGSKSITIDQYKDSGMKEAYGVWVKASSEGTVALTDFLKKQNDLKYIDLTDLIDIIDIINSVGSQSPLLNSLEEVKSALLQDIKKPIDDIIEAARTSELQKAFNGLSDWWDKQIGILGRLEEIGAGTPNWMNDIATAAKYQAQDLIDSYITPVTKAWEDFFSSMSTSALAPVQSIESFQNKFDALLSASASGALSDIQALQQFTTGEYLPFMKAASPDYKDVWGDLFGAGGAFTDMSFDLGKVEIDNTALAVAIREQLAPYLEEKNGETRIVLQLDGSVLKEFVINTMNYDPDAYVGA